ncbi:hypothetical protein BDP27DRAFT_1429715 [Rhodocollybia butyracea]|uniref:Uncharacterized protein n=1 Tax=Rhodocollybia butyracea TaxID=206335 RepID=A0A9P5TZV7_9AGAR|nr:hypothetical protein BDP27DRAFT_1429715 [Rhodocollybia butyracea]
MKGVVIGLKIETHASVLHQFPSPTDYFVDIEPYDTQSRGTPEHDDFYQSELNGGVRTEWNKAAADVLCTHLRSMGMYRSYTKDLVRKAFLAHITELKRDFTLQNQNGTKTIDQKDEETRQKAPSTKRSFTDIYYKDPGPLGELARFIQLLTVECMSGDETGSDGGLTPLWTQMQRQQVPRIGTTRVGWRTQQQDLSPRLNVSLELPKDRARSSQGSSREGKRECCTQCLTVRGQPSRLKVPVITAYTPVDPSKRYDPAECVCVHKYDDHFEIAGGANHPKIISCVGSREAAAVRMSSFRRPFIPAHLLPSYNPRSMSDSASIASSTAFSATSHASEPATLNNSMIGSFLGLDPLGIGSGLYRGSTGFNGANTKHPPIPIWERIYAS